MNTTFSARRRRGLLAAGVAAALLNLAGATLARADDRRLVHVEVVDRDHGDTLHVWRDHGRPVVAGRPGARYALNLVNDSGERVLAVVAVDGVNVISGETAGVGQRGYVLDPWQHAEITGWRKSDDEVAAFEFTALPDSYAARTGRPQDVGVIGVAVFREAQVLDISARRPVAPVDRKSAEGAPPPAPAPDAPRARAPAADALVARAQAAPQERLGTGHGARETSVVQTVPFQRASATPDQRIEIRYDSLENLVAAGIVPPPRVAAATPPAPRPFPADPPRGYVPDPPAR